MSLDHFNNLKVDLKECIKKYPHIIVREMEMVERYVGKTKKLVSKEDNNTAKTILDINIIKELEKKKELIG